MTIIKTFLKENMKKGIFLLVYFLIVSQFDSWFVYSLVFHVTMNRLLFQQVSSTFHIAGSIINVFWTIHSISTKLRAICDLTSWIIFCGNMWNMQCTPIEDLEANISSVITLKLDFQIEVNSYHDSHMPEIIFNL